MADNIGNWYYNFTAFCSRKNEDFELDERTLGIALVQDFSKEVSKGISMLSLVKISEYLKKENVLHDLQNLINQEFLKRFSGSESKVKFFCKNLSEKEKINLTNLLLENQEYELLLLLPKN